MAKGLHDERYKAVIGQLVERRREMGLSQAALGAVLGQHQQFVSRYEVGERRLDIVEFIDVARKLGLDPSALTESVPAKG